MFGGSFNFEEGTPRTNFDSFNSAFVTSFVVLSMENWQVVMYYALRTEVTWIVTTLYFVSWIFVGNFMLLNLFLAILLDSFADIEEDENLSKERQAERQIKFWKISRKRRERIWLWLFIISTI